MQEGGRKAEDRWKGKVSRQHITFTKHKHSLFNNTSLPSSMILSLISYYEPVIQPSGSDLQWFMISLPVPYVLWSLKVKSCTL